MENEILSKIAKRLRINALRMTTNAGSGHPTTAMSVADIAACLFFDEMHFNVLDPNDLGNDEIVFSKGHASPLVWALYAEAGILKQEDLMGYRKFDSVLEGHPTPRMPWIKAATGSLGQGLSISLGMAIANSILKTPARIYCILGDGELAEGSVWEAAELAGFRKQSNLCAIADINRLGQSDPTMFQHDLDSYESKFSAFGWNTIKIDGHNISEILAAFEKARSIKDKPTMILAKTLKGKGVSFLEDKEGWHGKPLKPDQLEAALKELGDFPDVKAEVKPAHQTDAKLPDCSSPVLPIPEYAAPEATRMAFGKALEKLGIDPCIVAVDGDTKNSTYTEFFFKKYPERSVECWIAEQNMMGISVGLSAKGLIPFAATFAAFHARSFDFVRMAAYSRANLKICGSHVGVSIGEDGPSQMGLEDLAMFRSIIDSVVLYPSDAVSAEKLTFSMADHKGIAYMRTTRPKTPILYDSKEEFPIGGSKLVKSSDDDKALVIAAGITLHEAVKAADILSKSGINIRVLDCYSVKPLDVEGIRKAASSSGNKVIVVEDHYAEGGLGEAVAAQAGLKIKHLCVRSIPRSGKPEELMAYMKIDSAAIMESVKDII